MDRLYGWKSSRNAPICVTMKQQSKDVKNEFNMRLTQVNICSILPFLFLSFLFVSVTQSSLLCCSSGHHSVQGAGLKYRPLLQQEHIRRGYIQHSTNKCHEVRLATCALFRHKLFSLSFHDTIYWIRLLLFFQR